MKDDTSRMVGPYLVRLQASAASPSAMPLFYVFLNGQFIGKSLSMPSLSDIEWLRRQNREGTLYASVTTTYRKRELRGRALQRKRGA